MNTQIEVITGRYAEDKQLEKRFARESLVIGVVLLVTLMFAI